MRKIYFDGVGRRIPSGLYHAWFVYTEYPVYSWSLRSFYTEADATEYGKRVADRYNRIFWEGEVKDVQP